MSTRTATTMPAISATSMTREPGPAAPSRAPIQLFRIASLVVPSACAWDVAFSAPHPSRLTEAVTLALAPLWALMALAIVFRAAGALVRRHRGASAPLLDQIDVLTASGSALAWFSGGAIMASVWLGWASLSVVGLMGTALLHVLVLWTCAAVRGGAPFRRARVSRRFIPERAFEGAEVTEELRIADVHIPSGFRLFVSGRVGPRWAMSRYAIEGTGSDGELVLESEIGPALRGEHQAEPLSLWLQDVFGLCRSVRLTTGTARLTVLPKARAIESVDPLLGQGGSDLEPRPASALPTEGSFRLREYQAGDDARRIHWVRSLASRELVVRLPDELPPDLPRVRLVLDTFLPCASDISSSAPAELLDALVDIWLGVARALAEKGVRVTLVTAAPTSTPDEIAIFRRALALRTPEPTLELGARVRWQHKMPVADLLTKDPSFVVSYRLQPDPPDRGSPRWIVVPEPMWTRFDAPPQMSSLALLPHPVGSAENRWSRRRRDRWKRERARRDHITFTDLCAHVAERREGSFFVWPVSMNRARLEALR